MTTTNWPWVWLYIVSAMWWGQAWSIEWRLVCNSLEHDAA